MSKFHENIGFERRFINFETSGIELRDSENEQKIISGYAAIFYNNDSKNEFKSKIGPYMVIERIMPGAFDSILKNNDDVRGLFNHDPNYLLGRTKSGTLKLSQDSHGLKYDITPSDTQVCRDVIISIKRGDLTGSSFGFRVKSQTRKEEGENILIREITEIDMLRDVGPVTFPAFEATEANYRDLESAVSELENFKAEEKRKLTHKMVNIRLQEIQQLEKSV